MSKLDLVKEVKNNLNIVEFVSEATNLSGNKNVLKGLCPFHNEKTPSFVVFPETQTWRCFGACSSGGDIFDFIMNSENINFPQALSIAAKRAGITLDYKSEIKNDNQTSIIHANEIAASYFQSLIKSPEGMNAKNYLKERGIDEGIITRRGLGINYEGMNTLADYLKSKEIDGSTAVQSGLLVKWNNNTWKDAFTNRITIEIRDEDNKLVGFGARSLSNNLPKYINTQQTELFNKSKILYGLNWAKESIKESMTAVIVEGYFDVITAHENGFKNVVGCMGTSVTNDHLEILDPLCSKIILALDSDNAGKKATYNNLIKIISNFEDPDLLHEKIYICESSEGKDPDIIIRDNPESWKLYINDVKSLIHYLIENINYTYNLSNNNELFAAAQSIYPIIATINIPQEQNSAYDHLAKKLKTPRNQLPKPKIIKNKYKYNDFQSWQNNEVEHENKLEERIINFIIKNRELVDSAKIKIDPKYFSNSIYKHLYEKILSDVPLEDILEQMNKNSDEFSFNLINKILGQSLPFGTKENLITELNDYSTRLQENYFRNRKTDQEKIMKELKFGEKMSDNDNRSWEPIVEKANKDNQELKKVMLSRYKQ